jgi:hypothetical protein
MLADAGSAEPRQLGVETVKVKMQTNRGRATHRSKGESGMRITATAAAIAILTLATAVNAAPKKPAFPKPHPAKPAVFYDFKGARLGMTLAEWKALPAPTHPSENLAEMNYGQPQVVCDGDGTESHQFYPSRAERAANVVECGYAQTVTIGTYRTWESASIPIGEYAASDVVYKFMDGKLYEISITANESLTSDILEGLAAKWGEPDSVVNDTTQNKAGATFPHTIKTWKNSAALIRFEAPFSRIDDLNVTYETTEGLAHIAAIEKTINPDADKM